MPGNRFEWPMCICRCFNGLESDMYCDLRGGTDMALRLGTTRTRRACNALSHWPVSFATPGRTERERERFLQQGFARSRPSGRKIVPSRPQTFISTKTLVLQVIHITMARCADSISSMGEDGVMAVEASGLWEVINGQIVIGGKTDEARCLCPSRACDRFMHVFCIIYSLL